MPTLKPDTTPAYLNLGPKPLNEARAIKEAANREFAWKLLKLLAISAICGALLALR